MEDEEKSKEQLLDELQAVRRRLVQLEKDQSEQERAEEALQASEHRYRQLLSSVTDYHFTIAIEDGQPVSTTHGRGCEAVTGYTLEDYARMPLLWYEMVHPEDRPAVKQHAETTLRGEATDPLEHRILHKDASTRWVRNTMVPRFDILGRLVACDGLVSDITERKRAEEALRESETKFRDLAEKSVAGIYLVQDGLFKYVNARCAEIHGYTVEEMIDKKGPQDTAYPEDWPLIAENLRKRLCCEVETLHYEFRILTKNQDTKDVEVFGSHTVYQARPAVIGTLLDITERKRTEEALRASETKYRIVADNTYDWEYWVSPEGRSLYSSPSCQRITGYSASAFEADPRLLSHIFHPDDLRQFEAHPEPNQSDNTPCKREFRIIHRDGTTRWIGHVCQPAFDANGAFLGRRGSNRDITDRKRSEEALENAFADLERQVEERTAALRVANEGLQQEIRQRKRMEEALLESETRYRELFASVPDAIFIFDAKTRRFIDMNESALSLYGYSYREFLNLKQTEISAEPEVSELSINETLAANVNVRIPLRYHRKKDGTVFPVEISGGTFDLAGRRVLFAAIRDITERMLAEQELNRYRHHLEDLVTERTAELASTNERLTREIEVRRRAEAALIKSEKTLQESESNLRYLASQLFSIQETERKRISKELHDGLGQELTVLKMNVASIQKRLRSDQQALKDECEFLLSYIDDSIEDTRRLCQDLSPYLLEELGLTASLGHLFAEVCQRNDLLCSIEMEPFDVPLPRRTLVAIYRIFQEALTNIVKHAAATQVSLSIKRRAGALEFVVADDGKGFDLRSVSRRPTFERGMGLFAMEERARIPGGSFQIETQEGQGTRVWFSLPISEKGEP